MVAPDRFCSLKNQTPGLVTLTSSCQYFAQPVAIGAAHKVVPTSLAARTRVPSFGNNTCSFAVAALLRFMRLTSTLTYVTRRSFLGHGNLLVVREP